MIGRKDDVGVFEQTFLAERGNDRADLEIDLLDQPRVVLANRVLRRVRKLRVVDAVPGPLVALDVVLPQLRRVARDLGYRPWDVRLVYALEEPRIGVVRTVRAGEPDHHGEGLISTVFLDELHRFGANKSVPRMLPRNVVKHRSLVLVVAGHLVAVQLPQAVPAQIVVVIVTDLEPPLVFADNAVLEATPFVPRIEVHLADSGGVITGFSKDFGPGPNPRLSPVGAQILQVARHPVADRVHAGEQGGPGGHADWRTRERVCVAHAVFCDGIDVWSVEPVGAVAPGKVGPELVGKEEDDVRSLRVV